MDIFSDDVEINDLAVAKKLFSESKTGFLKLFNNNAVCMSMTDVKRTYVRVNKKFLEKFGYKESEVIGKTSLEVGILNKEESARVGSLIVEKGGLQNDYVRCFAKDGKAIHTVSSIESMEMNGETYLVSFFLDITKIIEQQGVIEQHVQQLEAANKELETFSYSVSHDLKTPLRAINTYTQLLERKITPFPDEEVKRLFSNIQKNTIKMGHLIDDLLAFSKLERTAIVKVSISMEQLIGDVLIDMRQMTHNADIRLGKLLPVQGDYALIKQVIINLISNSIKYSSKKEAPVVEIGSEMENAQVIYTIKDNGVGFDMKYADKLFGVFQRMHTEEEFEGTGVGLAIVQRIIMKHGGTIHAKAELEKGASFSFSLPNEPSVAPTPPL